MTLTALSLALAIGVVMGLLGGGGSILAVPALTMLLHFAPKEAVVISLSMVAMAASAGALGSFYRGTLCRSPPASWSASPPPVPSPAA